MQHHWSAASLFCLLAVVFPFVTHVNASAFRRPTVQIPEEEADLPTDLITAIHVYHVLDGKCRKTVIPNSEIHAGAFSIRGYVSGIVVFCGGELKIQMEGRRFSKLSKNADGSFSAKFFGRLLPGVTSSGSGDNAYFEKSPAVQPTASVQPPNRAGYSLFPEVTGNAVSERPFLELALETDTSRFDITIEQADFEPSALLQDPQAGPEAVYIGTRLKRLRQEIPDFDRRLTAVQRGISKVEQRLGLRLISKMILLDYAAIHNAISCEKSDDIWFYIETFRNEPVPELETIAAHETIHKYVDRQRLTRSDAVRKWFSDLKGHDLFSMERFLLLTQGMLPSDAEASEAENRLFFAFIDERNFLEDRKGGHSRDNLDEFCTSFIHSVLHIHRLKENLHGRILRQGNTPRPLTGPEKKALLKTFQGTLRVFEKVFNRRANADSAPDQLIFANAMSTAAQVQIQPDPGMTTAVLTPHPE